MEFLASNFYEAAAGIGFANEENPGRKVTFTYQ